VLSHASVSSRLGAAISLDRDRSVLAVVGDNIHLFRLVTGDKARSRDIG
jgi:hypothetical protein